MKSSKELANELLQAENEDLQHLQVEFRELLKKYDAKVECETVISTGALPQHRWFFTKKR